MLRTHLRSVTSSLTTTKTASSSSPLLIASSARFFSDERKTIPISNLKPPKTGLEADDANNGMSGNHHHPTAIDHELSGTPNLQWLANLPKFNDLLEKATKFPDANEFWQSPTHSALEQVASAQPYFEILKTISEHGFFFLIPKALLARDAPLPHIAYEDIMQCLLTCSMQRPPEEQFQLPPAVLRLMLCTAAHHILHDRAYFRTVEGWFRNHLERTQSLSSESWSAWVMCCVAANRIDSALMFLRHMEENKINFDPVVFNFMLHPSEIITNESGVPNSPLNRHIAKGFLGQQRLLKTMQGDDGTFASGVHAMFVYYAITRQPVQQWEVIRVAVQTHRSKLSDRTIKMMLAVFKHEKGRRCGPMTVRALVKLFAVRGDMFHTCLVLAMTRQREVARVQKALGEKTKTMAMSMANRPASNNTNHQLAASMMMPTLKFSAEEEHFVLKCFQDQPTHHHQHHQANRSAPQGAQERHLPLLKHLLRGEMKNLPSSSSSDSAVIKKNSSSFNHVVEGNRNNYVNHQKRYSAVDDENDEEEYDSMTQLIMNISQLKSSLSLSSQASNTSVVENAHAPKAHFKEVKRIEQVKKQQEEIAKKVVSEKDMRSLIEDDVNAAFNPDRSANESMAMLAAETRRIRKEDEELASRSASAWMNPIEDAK